MNEEKNGHLVLDSYRSSNPLKFEVVELCLCNSCLGLFKLRRKQMIMGSIGSPAFVIFAIFHQQTKDRKFNDLLKNSQLCFCQGRNNAPIVK